MSLCVILLCVLKDSGKENHTVKIATVSEAEWLRGLSCCGCSFSAEHYGGHPVYAL